MRPPIYSTNNPRDYQTELRCYGYGFRKFCSHLPSASSLLATKLSFKAHPFDISTSKCPLHCRLVRWYLISKSFKSILERRESGFWFVVDLVFKKKVYKLTFNLKSYYLNLNFKREVSFSCHFVVCEADL